MPVGDNTLSHYTLFCGVILFNEHSVPKIEEAQPWASRLNHSSEFLQYLNKSYYQNYLSNIVPELNSPGDVKHFTLRSIYQSPLVGLVTLNKEDYLSIVIPYFDVFIFQDGVAIFAFKAQTSPELSSYQNISRMISHIRQPGSTLVIESHEITVLDLVKKYLSSVLSLRADWDQYIPQLKAYTIIDDPKVSKFDDSIDRSLYELSHVLPIGSSINSTFAPTDLYFQAVIGNSIAVYNNWKAITLFDTFTRISCSYPDIYKTWEHEYFLIYIHSLYTKFQLYSFNSRLKDVATASKKTKEIRNRFIEFINDYHLAYISYKFLPNFIYERINQSLEIQKELDRMEIKIERIHQANEERKGQQMNQLLLIISLLSILSVVTDLSQWLSQMGVSETIIYSPTVPFFLVGLIVAVSYWLFRSKK